jgi:hypothetical protein
LSAGRYPEYPSFIQLIYYRNSYIPSTEHPAAAFISMSRSLFIPANHMLLLYCILYAIGDLLRAFWFESDQSDDAVGISVIFFVLSIWLVINSILYYAAFIDEMEYRSHQISNTPNNSNVSMDNHLMRPVSPSIRIEGSGVSIALAEAAANGAVGLTSGNNNIPSDSENIILDDARIGTRNDSAGGYGSSDRATEDTGFNFTRIYRRWTFYLHTEVGLAYFLNIIGSVGYVVSSLISMFLTVNSIGTAREVDRASLYLDTINMLIFIIDAFLFAHVWWRENEETTIKGKMKSVYFC